MGAPAPTTVKAALAEPVVVAVLEIILIPLAGRVLMAAAVVAAATETAAQEVLMEAVAVADLLMEATPPRVVPVALMVETAAQAGTITRLEAMAQIPLAWIWILLAQVPAAVLLMEKVAAVAVAADTAAPVV